jgi:hypothetical protein
MFNATSLKKKLFTFRTSLLILGLDLDSNSNPLSFERLDPDPVLHIMEVDLKHW